MQFVLLLLSAVFVAAHNMTYNAYFGLAPNNVFAYTTEDLAANVTLVTKSTADEHLPKVDVKLTNTGNTLIEAAITNTGEYDLAILKLNNIFDHRNVRKVDINAATDGTPLAFEGIYVTPSRRTTADSWIHIAKGDVFVTKFDAADLYDLSSGGNYTVKAEGSAPIRSSTGYTDGQLVYSSNTLYMGVDGAEAARHMAARRDAEDRDLAAIQNGSGCTDEQWERILQGMAYCHRMATRGAQGAYDGDIRFADYFNTDLPLVRLFVQCKLLAVADACQLVGSGKARITCLDIFQLCNYNSLAVTDAQAGIIVICPLSLQYSPAFSPGCHQHDLATTLVHELTHIDGLHTFRGTGDYVPRNTWPYCKDLDWLDAIDNAQTYSSFAQSVFLQCDRPF
ncbi:neutral protease 2 [Diplodia corticola]|uniref:Neutral protease 2 n=1 Tax=Diplodia corticola TaxID=236234 RepID=A0A1J9R8I2_9PEZI|nr:neutral protease 2 [Diplodia corticola]OJD36888.1 neutral protease 2 [Diplodia corticola]